MQGVSKPEQTVSSDAVPLSDAQIKKAEQRNRRIPQVLALRESGFRVRELNPRYQYRINERLDIYPTWGKWHDIKLNKRGRFKGKSVTEFVEQFFEKAA